mgnify:CR=1 FL=1|jgi:hypothetical protein
MNVNELKIGSTDIEIFPKFSIVELEDYIFNFTIRILN